MLEVLPLVTAPKTFEDLAHDSAAIYEHHHGHLRHVVQPADFSARVVQHGVSNFVMEEKEIVASLA